MHAVARTAGRDLVAFGTAEAARLRIVDSLLDPRQRFEDDPFLNDVHERVDRVVAAGVKAYIGLLCCGEKERSLRVFSDTMQISSLARVLIFFTLRSLLASLLVLRVTAYWARVPALHDLQEACSLLNRCLGEGIAEVAHPARVTPAASAPNGLCGVAHRSVCPAKGGRDHGAAVTCRRPPQVRREASGRST